MATKKQDEVIYVCDRCGFESKDPSMFRRFVGKIYDASNKLIAKGEDNDKDGSYFDCLKCIVRDVCHITVGFERKEGKIGFSFKSIKTE